MSHTLPALLFDLDGTLTDSREGIFNSFRYTFEKLGIPHPPEAIMNRFLGPPIRTALQEILGMSAAEAERATAVYREYFIPRGMLENRIYDGIPALLDQLKDGGFTLAVATSKPTVYARRILEHFGLDGWFSVIAGAELDGSRGTKTEVIADALKGLDTGIAAKRAVMIGDRLHDIAGGREHGLSTIGVLWGYGDRSELSAAGADRLAETPEEIARFVSGEDLFR